MCSAMEQKILPTTPMLEIELINLYPHLEEFLHIAYCQRALSILKLNLILLIRILSYYTCF